jgi:hypothetical protein
MWATRRELKEALDTIHEALRTHDRRVDAMDTDNKRSLETIRATQVRVGLGVIGILITVILGLIAGVWELVRPALHFGGAS